MILAPEEPYKLINIIGPPLRTFMLFYMKNEGFKKFIKGRGVIFFLYLPFRNGSFQNFLGSQSQRIQIIFTWNALETGLFKDSFDTFLFELLNTLLISKTLNLDILI